MGNPFVHLDLATRDLAGARQFYKSLFDWQFEDMPAMSYSGIVVGPGGIGGGMGPTSMPEQPSTWTAYVSVDDIKATISKAEKLGATILVPWMEVGAMGWLGVFMDPQGATIGVWQSAEPPPAPAEAKPAKVEKAAKKAAKADKKADKKAAKAEKKAKKPEKKAAKKAAKVEKKAAKAAKKK